MIKWCQGNKTDTTFFQFRDKKMKTMKTKIVAIMLVLALALTLTKSTIVINSDGSAKMTTNIKD